MKCILLFLVFVIFSCQSSKRTPSSQQDDGFHIGLGDSRFWASGKNFVVETDLFISGSYKFSIPVIDLENVTHKNTSYRISFSDDSLDCSHSANLIATSDGFRIEYPLKNSYLNCYLNDSEERNIKLRYIIPQTPELKLANAHWYKDLVPQRISFAERELAIIYERLTQSSLFFRDKEILIDSYGVEYEKDFNYSFSFAVTKKRTYRLESIESSNPMLNYQLKCKRGDGELRTIQLPYFFVEPDLYTCQVTYLSRGLRTVQFSLRGRVLDLNQVYKMITQDLGYAQKILDKVRSEVNNKNIEIVRSKIKSIHDSINYKEELLKTLDHFFPEKRTLKAEVLSVKLSFKKENDRIVVFSEDTILHKGRSYSLNPYVRSSIVVDKAVVSDFSELSISVGKDNQDDYIADFKRQVEKSKSYLDIKKYFKNKTYQGIVGEESEIILHRSAVEVCGEYDHKYFYPKNVIAHYDHLKGDIKKRSAEGFFVNHQLQNSNKVLSRKLDSKKCYDIGHESLNFKKILDFQ